MRHTEHADGHTVQFSDCVAAAKAAVVAPRPSVQTAIARLGLQPGQAVLDAGCGPGVHLPLFAAAVGPTGTVTGLDHNADELKVAAILGDEASGGRIHLRQGDVAGSSFAAGSFDLVWLSAVMHHLEDPSAALIEIGRVLRPLGRVAVLDADLSASFPVLPWPPRLEEPLRAAAARAAADGSGGGLPYHFDAYLGRRLTGLLRSASFDQVTIHALPEIDQSPLPAAREAEIRNWFLGPFLERIEDYLAPVDRTALTDRLDPERPDYLLAAPGFFLLRTQLLVTGRRAP